jgi:hypothetical protein
MQALLVGHDLKVVVTHPSQPIGGIAYRELMAIVTGKINNWKDVGGPSRPMALVVHDHCPNYVEPVRQLLLDNKARWSKQALFVKTDQKHLETVARFESSIGINSWILAEPMVRAGELKVLTLDGVAPTVDAGLAGRYPLMGPMSMLFQRWRADIMTPFFEFLYGPEGRRIMPRATACPARCEAESAPRPVGGRYSRSDSRDLSRASRRRRRSRTAIVTAPTNPGRPRLANASPHASVLAPPPARSSTPPNTSGAASPAPKPKNEWIAMVAPRCAAGAAATTPAVSADESAITRT